jgi:hypothetical protein
VLFTAAAIEDDEFRGNALASLSQKMPQQLTDEALVAAKALKVDRCRASALAALAPSARPETRDREMREALETIEYNDLDYYGGGRRFPDYSAISMPNYWN